MNKFDIEAALMGGSSKAKFFHKDVIDELLPEAWGLLQGDLVERG